MIDISGAARKTALVVLVAVLAVLLPDTATAGGKHAASTADVSNTLVIPGRSIGPIYLGMPRPEVVRVLGEPDKTYDPPVGGAWGNRYDYDADDLKLMILFSVVPGDAVQSLSTDSPHFATAEGIRVGSSGNDVVSAYGSSYRRSVNGQDTMVEYPQLGLGFWLTSNNIVRDMYVMKVQ